MSWEDRELPILKLLVKRFDDRTVGRLSFQEIADALGLEAGAVDVALGYLATADPPYIRGPGAAGFRGPVLVTGVTERALRETGAWPTAAGLTDLLSTALADAADQEQDEGQRGRLRTAATWASGVGRAVLIAEIERHLVR